MIPDVSTPVSTALPMPPARRMALMARMWLRWPCSTGWPLLRSMPSDVPDNATSMSCTASALPESSTSHVAEANQVAEILCAAGVHHHRAGHERDAAAGAFDAPHHVGHARHGGFDAPLRRHLVAHEAEASACRATARPATRARPACRRRCDRPCGRREACGTRRRRVVDHQHGIHALIGRGRPTRRRGTPRCGDWWWSRSRPAPRRPCPRAAAPRSACP